MVTENTDKHGDRKIRVHSGPVLSVRAQKWSQKSPTTIYMETEKSVYILGVQKSRCFSTFLAGTSELTTTAISGGTQRQEFMT
jgi:hypothetical protein